MKLELIKDEHVYALIENSIRGGLSFVGKRYAKANNPYMADYDAGKEISYLFYIDARNLYGYSMSESLPYGNFVLIDRVTYPEEFMYLSTIDNIRQLEPYGKKCYFYNINGYFPDELHDELKDFPMFPENMEIQMLDCFSKIDKYNAKVVFYILFRRFLTFS